MPIVFMNDDQGCHTNLILSSLLHQSAERIFHPIRLQKVYLQDALTNIWQQKEVFQTFNIAGSPSFSKSFFHNLFNK